MAQKNISTLRSIPVHKTSHTTVSAQLISINGVPHVGLHRVYFPPDQEGQSSRPKPESKGVFLPLEAWETFITSAVPQLQEEIRQRQPAPASAASTSSTSTVVTTRTSPPNGFPPPKHLTHEAPNPHSHNGMFHTCILFVNFFVICFYF